MQRSTRDDVQTTDVAPQRAKPRHGAPSQAGEDKTHTQSPRRTHRNSADSRQKSLVAFIPAQSTPAQQSVQRAARALLSGLGEHETQTFLFHLTNGSSFQGRFSSAPAGERQTCRGMIRAGRQQINQAELPVSLMEKGEEAVPALGQHEMCRWNRL